MRSLILQTATQILKPLMILFSLFVLLRGHNEPGGGFVGGLVAATAFCLSAVAFDAASARQTLRYSPRYFIGVGLVFALLSGTIGMLTGHTYLTGVWRDINVPALGEVALGTPLLFDIGVYLVVFGVTLTIFFGLLEESRGT